MKLRPHPLVLRHNQQGSVSSTASLLGSSGAGSDTSSSGDLSNQPAVVQPIPLNLDSINKFIQNSGSDDKESTQHRQRSRGKNITRRRGAVKHNRLKNRCYSSLKFYLKDEILF